MAECAFCKIAREVPKCVPSCAAYVCPRGTHEDQVRIYRNLLEMYGWKEA